MSITLVIFPIYLVKKQFTITEIFPKSPQNFLELV